MSEVETRRHWTELTPLVDWLVSVLSPVCEEVVIAGSYRRESEAVGDLEVVACPKWETPAPEIDLFGEPVDAPEPAYPGLDAVLRECREADHLYKGRVDGQLMKSFEVGIVIPGFEGQKIDMFIAKPGNFGNILAIRTGPWEYSRNIVTPWAKGGKYMPMGMHHEDGYLYRNKDRVPCRTERDFYEALGLPYVHPKDRR